MADKGTNLHVSWKYTILHLRIQIKVNSPVLLFLSFLVVKKPPNVPHVFTLIKQQTTVVTMLRN
jgi:hypothetical protein